MSVKLSKAKMKERRGHIAKLSTIAARDYKVSLYRSNLEPEQKEELIGLCEDKIKDAEHKVSARVLSSDFETEQVEVIR